MSQYSIFAKFCKISVLDALCVPSQISSTPLFSEGYPDTLKCTPTTTAAFDEFPELTGIELGPQACVAIHWPYQHEIVTLISRFE
jgi:hypothetical protein